MHRSSMLRWLAVMLVCGVLFVALPAIAYAQTGDYAYIPNSAEASVSKVNLDPTAPPAEIARYSTIEPRPGVYGLADYRVSRLALDSGGNAWAHDYPTAERNFAAILDYITNLRAREARLMEQVQRFRPYSDNPNAPPLPEQIASEIINTVKGLQVYEEELAKNTAERARLTSEFASDIARFKELKGIQ